jgi:hypothetical protein
MAKQDDKTIGEILDDMEFRNKVFKYAKIGAFLGVTGLFIYFKGYTRGVPYGYGMALDEIRTTFPEIFEELLKATMTVK